MNTTTVRTYLSALLLALLTIFSSIAHTAEPINTLEKKLFGWAASGLAIQGYDPVAYFKDASATPGKPEHSLEWNGATWHFANAANQALFQASPDTFAPQYGGYCAYGVAQGYLVKVEPEQWSIIDGKLYLNYDANVQSQWQAEQQRFISEADERFPRLLEQ